ncbi:glutamate-1-semialdehyde 2,1-aminomutase [Candidatus Methanoperedens nitratireducens]|uniref:Glutamate-1-semialdehyde 2,1-aminomutase n=1 Tax=Candidatus Methanoperedens nitratireducens TaxID=1392998 RepID=A0A284VQY4_9EURY|nr:glutamate-1-semialdehyde 2,1-aminomutase [Candidatus Methanoperedens nitroreducens]SNQ61701.1 Glutamate-1-semialdehyde 2,1-aminomutase [Candidatus Methanoperedens nitroreducens]
MGTEKSRKLFEEAKKVLPGGVSSPVRAIKPYPFYTKRANGSKITDIDGNEYIDYVMGYGPLLLGHNHPAIKEAVIRQLPDGWLYGTPTELEVALAKEIIRLYASIDMVRFVSTGTEATMGALRAARGFTKKNKFIKIEGGFHGAHEAVLVKAGSGATTLGTPNSAGVPPDFTKNTLQVPYNDIEAMTAVIEAYKDDVAAIIIEPVLGNIGPIVPKKGYLEDVRAVTRENDVLLIFDEVITGFRLAMGGAQEYYGVTPDMTTLGKILGGGFHIGVIGGKREIMENISPAGAVYQAGTFNGSPVSMSAGLAVISTLKKEKVHEKVNKAGDAMRSALVDVAGDLGLDYSVSGVGSMFKVFFGDTPYNYQDTLKCDTEKFNVFFKKMLSDGIFLPPSQFETNFLSLAHSQDDINKTIEAYQRNLK